MELNVGLEESFQSIDDFYATFPNDYEVLFFCKEDPYTGKYNLCKYSDGLNFKKRERYNIIVYPTEKKRFIMKAYQHNQNAGWIWGLKDTGYWTENNGARTGPEMAPFFIHFNRQSSIDLTVPD